MSRSNVPLFPYSESGWRGQRIILNRPLDTSPASHEVNFLYYNKLITSRWLRWNSVLIASGHRELNSSASEVVHLDTIITFSLLYRIVGGVIQILMMCYS